MTERVQLLEKRQEEREKVVKQCVAEIAKAVEAIDRVNGIIDTIRNEASWSAAL